ncbi:unnamed protein product [Lactuca virosa]|uniref:Uncharacterized protein n=1 Tax=Lactuca virosa TaxID=75947 RepID=A0AAU9M310_9ASTR|nr:unnamed protein product [Lactuca virosa]
MMGINHLHEMINHHLLSDDAKKGENFTESTANDDVDAEMNTEDIHDQLDVGDEVYCMDLSFFDAVPFQIVFPYSHANAESDKIPQGEEQVPQGGPSDIESDEDDVPLSKK